MQTDAQDDAPKRTFEYEGELGLSAEEGGYTASDIVLVDDRSEARDPDWWDGRSLHRVIEEMAGAPRADDGRATDDVRLAKVRILIEVLD